MLMPSSRFPFSRFSPLLAFVPLVAAALFLSACGEGGGDAVGDADEALTVYSGRSQPLVDGLVERFEEQADFDVEVRYGTDAQLLSVMQEEGQQSPADLYWANTTGALAQARQANLLAQMPDSLTQQAAAFQPQSGRWSPVTTRFRTLAYNSEAVDTTALPSSVLELPELSQFEGRIGWTPTYSSFQDFVTAMRATRGADSTRTWLNQMQELNPKSYSSNTPMIQALADGEIDLALTNHYYVLRLKHGGGEGEYEGEEEGEEEGGASEEEEAEEATRPGAPVEMYRFADGDVGNLALVTGASVMRQSDQPQQAQQFLQFLLSPKAQQFAAQQVNEYPVVEDAPVPEYMMPVDQALSMSPQLRFDQLQNLDATLELMREAGLM
jgi:iron(III) transport system substrate-binding protein